MFICARGNLAAPVEIEFSDQGPQTRAVVVVNSSRKAQDGRYAQTGSETYHLAVRGAAAEHLRDLSQECGNVAVLFTGSVSLNTWTDPQGMTRMYHNVLVSDIAVDLKTQKVTVPGKQRESYPPAQQPPPRDNNEGIIQDVPGMEDGLHF